MRSERDLKSVAALLLIVAACSGSCFQTDTEHAASSDGGIDAGVKDGGASAELMPCNTALPMPDITYDLTQGGATATATLHGIMLGGGQFIIPPDGGRDTGTAPFAFVDLSRGSVTRLPDMPVALNGTMTEMQDGRIALVGGFHSFGSSFTSGPDAEVYNPDSKSWTYVHLPRPFSKPALGSLPNGDIVIATSGYPATDDEEEWAAVIHASDLTTEQVQDTSNDIGGHGDQGMLWAGGDAGALIVVEKMYDNRGWLLGKYDPEHKAWRDAGYMATEDYAESYALTSHGAFVLAARADGSTNVMFGDAMTGAWTSLGIIDGAATTWVFPSQLDKDHVLVPQRYRQFDGGWGETLWLADGASRTFQAMPDAGTFPYGSFIHEPGSDRFLFSGNATFRIRLCGLDY